MLNSFHIDILIFPLSFLYFYLIKLKKFRGAILTLVLFCLVKEIYILISIIYSIMLIKKINIHKLIILNLFFLLSFICLYFYIIPQFTFFNIDNINQSKNYRVNIYDWIYDLNFTFDLKFYFKKLILIFAIIFFYFISFFKSNKRYLLISVLILSIFVFSQNTNHSSIYSHYLIPLCAPMFFSFQEYYEKELYNDIKLKNFIIIYICFFHILISPSPLSLSFYSKINYYFNYENYYNLDKLDEKEFINDFFVHISNKKIISSTNDTYHTILDKFDYYLPYPAGLNQNFYLPEKIKFYRLFEIITNKYNLKQVLLEPDYIIMRKNNYWIYDEKYINDYQKINNKNQNKLNTEYYIKEKFKEILIYAKK